MVTFISLCITAMPRNLERHEVNLLTLHMAEVHVNSKVVEIDVPVGQQKKHTSLSRISNKKRLVEAQNVADVPLKSEH